MRVYHEFHDCPARKRGDRFSSPEHETTCPDCLRYRDNVRRFIPQEYARNQCAFRLIHYPHTCSHPKAWGVQCTILECPLVKEPVNERDEANKVARLIIAKLDEMAQRGMREGRIRIVANALIAFRAQVNNGLEPTGDAHES